MKDDIKDDIPDPSDLPIMDQAALDMIIQRHTMYLRGQIGGARCVLRYQNLSNLSFRGHDLTQSDFSGSALVNTDLSNGNFMGANFFACDMRNANMSGANLSRTDLRGAYIAGANLTRANLQDADMREGKIMKRGENGMLEDRKRSAGSGSKTILTGAKLSATNMNGIQAQSADFTDADLSSVSMAGANLSGVNFEGANLADSDMSNADLSGANMNDAIIAGATLSESAKFSAILENAITERDMGANIINLGKSLEDLLEEHTIWVSTAGRKGRQLDLSGYDVRDVVNLRSYPFTAIRAVGTNFLKQNLQSADLQSAVFDRSDFRDCIMDNADLRASSIKYAEMARVTMRGAMLCPLFFDRPDGSKRIQRTDLSGTNLRYADISESDFRDCIMMGADLTGANLSGCDLRRADLTGALLKGAIFKNARLEETIIDTSAI